MELSVDCLRRPLITGAGGFIGSHLTRRLANLPETEEVICVDLPNSPRMRELDKLKKVTFIPIDLGEAGNLIELPKDITGIFALAALNGTSRFYREPFTVFLGSLLPTINLLKHYSNTAPLVYASSSEVYASTISNFGGLIPTNESVLPSIEDIHNPRWSYATAKLAGEVAVNAASVQLNSMTSIVRYHNVYGPNMGFDHFIPDFVARAKKGVYEITGSEETRSFLHIEDAIDGTIAALKAADQCAEIYHLGSSQEVQIKDAAQIILNQMNIKNFTITSLPGRTGSVKRRLADTKKAQEKLNWQAQTSLEEGIQDYLLNNLE